jgi:hypothetical protein
MMALGTHWEWRGFGAVSGAFARLYCDLEPCYGTQTVEDIYLWIPGMQVNAKFRTGVQDGLKFKRIENTDDDLEQWTERPDELFEFPLDSQGWNTLKEVLANAGLRLPDYPLKAPDQTQSLVYLKEVGCRAITVRKIRESKIWQRAGGRVMVEWACITAPQPCISIGLETMETENKSQNFLDDDLKNRLKNAIQDLALKKEALRIINYMDAVGIWASGKFI